MICQCASHAEGLSTLSSYIYSMNKDLNYLSINRASWNRRTPVHLSSDFYGMDEFIKGKTSLKPIELNLLGDVKGKNILHLQCHFGQDSLSLARMGAKVTGMDFSDRAIEEARALAIQLHSDAKFICCDIYSLPEHLNEAFDIVFTSYGTIGWLPDLHLWAGIIHRYLKPGGKFVFVEFHPAVWMFDDDFKEIKYNYFNTGPIHETESGTYAQQDADIKIDYIGWNHSTGEVLSSLLNNGIRLLSFEEYNYSPYACFKNTVKIEEGKFRIPHLGDKLPMVFSLVGIKEG